MNHDTLMALAETYVMTYYPTGGYKEARAALSTAVAEVLAERENTLEILKRIEPKVDALIAERDALAKDAARYRAMRTACATQDHAFMDALQEHLPETLEQFDAAIDAAMKGTPT